MKTKIEKAVTGVFTNEYFRFGKGKTPLVILPGVSVQSVMLFADAIEEAYAPLADGFDIYVLDRRKELPEKYDVYGMAKDTAEVFDALGIKNACVFGASQGGMIALVLALTRPDLVGKLALGSTCARISGETKAKIDVWAKAAEEKDAEKLFFEFGRLVYPKEVFEASKDALSAAAKAATPEELSRFAVFVRAMDGFDVSQSLGSLSCPVLLLASSDDGVFGKEDFELMKNGLKEIRGFAFHLYDSYGHAAYDLAPDYKERLLRFFKEH